MKKKLAKIAALAMAAVSLVLVTVFVTVAFLTSTSTVNNSFTVGNVGIKLLESKVNTDGTLDGDSKVGANSYHLIPGKTYIKDPVVYVDAQSEDSYLFVKVTNGIVDYEVDEDSIKGETIAEQMAAN